MDIPQRADTLRIMQLISPAEPILMLKGGSDDYGTRWTLSGQQIEPSIVRFLQDHAYLMESGKTEFGALRLCLSPAGVRFRDEGIVWWQSLGWWQRLKVVLLG